MELIPVNKRKAEEFEDKLSRDLFHRSSDNFIAIYNNKLINVNNSEINKTAQEIVQTYKNVSISNGKFIVKSKEEIIAEEFIVIFPHILFIATLKRIAKDILSENYPQDTEFIFTESKNNIVQIFDPSSNTVRDYEGAEKLRRANEAIATNPFLQKNVKIKGYKDDGISFKVVDVLKIDTSLIENIEVLIDNYLK